MILLVTHDIAIDDGARVPWIVALLVSRGHALDVLYARREGDVLYGEALWARLDVEDEVAILRAGWEALKRAHDAAQARVLS